LNSIRYLALGVSAAALVAFAGVNAQAASMSNGFLSMSIDNTNGAITSATLGGTEFYQIDALVSDYGFQVGTNTSTFAVARTDGSISGAGLTVSSVTQLTARSVRVNARYQPNATTDISISRTYTLLNGLNVVRIDQSLFNNRFSGTTVVRSFDVNDPDQGGSGSNTTINDVTNIQEKRVGIASIASGLSVGIGGSPNAASPQMIVGFGTGSSPFGLDITTGGELNTFFSSPFDPNGASSDSGLAVGRQLGIEHGTSKVFRYYQAFGTTVADVEAGFILGAKSAPSGASARVDALVTPIPAALPLLATAMGGLGLVGWRRIRKARA